MDKKTERVIEKGVEAGFNHLGARHSDDVAEQSAAKALDHFNHGRVFRGAARTVWAVLHTAAAEDFRAARDQNLRDALE